MAEVLPAESEISTKTAAISGLIPIDPIGLADWRTACDDVAAD